MLNGTWVGADMGGTWIKLVVLRDGEVVERTQTRTVRGTAPATVAGLALAVSELVARTPGVAGVGITIPGLFDADGCGVVLPNVPGEWAGQPILAPVRDAAGVPVRLTNDARAFGLAELTLGAARGARTAVGVVLGTGIGGVIIVDGHVHLGTDGGAGELGHQVLQPDGPPCGCGNRGCLEAFARSGIVAEMAGTPTIRDAVAAASRGEPRASAAITTAARHIGHGLANLVTVLQPEVVFIGGGVAAAGPVLLDPLEAELRRLSPLVRASSYRVVTGELGPWAGSIGAALAVATVGT